MADSEGPGAQRISAKPPGRTVLQTRPPGPYGGVLHGGKDRDNLTRQQRGGAFSPARKGPLRPGGVHTREDSSVPGHTHDSVKPNAGALCASPPIPFDSHPHNGEAEAENRTEARKDSLLSARGSHVRGDCACADSDRAARASQRFSGLLTAAGLRALHGSLVPACHPRHCDREETLLYLYLHSYI